MVKINLLIEGGNPSENSDILTIGNNAVLRQSFNEFFTRLLSRNDIGVSLGFGYRNAAKEFSGNNDIDFLFVDSDTSPQNLETWFVKIEEDQNPIIIPENRKKNVIFMIQEMEAWFLKQPECILKWSAVNGFKRLHPKESLEQHSLLQNNIEQVSKPSQKLYDIIKHFFERDGKKIKYNKMKDSPGLIDSLDPIELMKIDIQLQNFVKQV
ncbi:MAG: DUF4276 family protein [Muribaculaceae bacterium]|nr:DUF4276 family protein [Muribaculaceae bacterium]